MVSGETQSESWIASAIFMVQLHCSASLFYLFETTMITRTTGR
jgi:hypothetical protein